MSHNRKIIGFDRRIQLGWLDETAELVRQGFSTEDIRAALWQFLEHQIGGKSKDGAIRKTVTVLNKIWVKVPEDLYDFRNDAFDLLVKMPRDYWFPIHWGMTLIAYPFFTELVGQIGRMSRLQDTITLNQIRKRVVASWGDTERVHRSVRHVVQSLKDWGVLIQTGDKGSYKIRSSSEIESAQLGVWLLETAFMALGREIKPFAFLAGHPVLFPFNMTMSSREIALHPRLEAISHGSGDTMIQLSGYK